MFLELLKSFGTGVGMVILAIIGIILFCVACYWVERILKAVFGKLPKIPENVSNWLISIAVLIFFVVLATSLGYDARHDS